MSKANRLVLYVEDDMDHAELVRRCLTRHAHGGAIVHIGDGEAALDYLARIDAETVDRPGLILLDLRLPKVDGLEVLRSVKTNPKLSDIPVVVLTTSANDADIERAYEQRANSYLVKPEDFPSLDEMMKSLGSYWLYWNALPAVEQ
ncbi:MAG: response regulator [Polyangiaceae bacterium]